MADDNSFAVVAMPTTIIFRGRKAYIFPKEGFITFDADEAEQFIKLQQNIDKSEQSTAITDYASLTICLQSSHRCNLRCAYCFSSNRNKAQPLFSFFRPLIDQIINAHPEKSRFYLDLSGDREPLLNLPFVIAAAEYAREKSEAIRKEVLVQFVCNGTLLSRQTATLLKKTGILYEVSLDGPTDVQNVNRPTAGGGSTYDVVIKNVESLDDRSFLGCALTISKTRFDLLNTMQHLLPLFPTISVKPVRLRDGFDADDIEYWEKEYDRLADYLVDRIVNADFRMIRSLLNGSDYFGKFILRSILDIHPLNRCDAGKGRLFLTDDGIYPCPPLGEFKQFKSERDQNYTENNGDVFFRSHMHQAACESCVYKVFCGGECSVESEYHHGVNELMCRLKKHLILLATELKERVWNQNVYAFDELVSFCRLVIGRKLPNPVFEAIVKNNPDKTFQECKDLYYSSHH